MEDRVSNAQEISPHTKWQRELYTITPIVRARLFESNEAWRASQNADHTARRPSVVEFGQPADVAAQPKLGLLPERGPGAGSGTPARIVASWKNLRFPTHDEGQQQKEKPWPRRVCHCAHTAAFAVWVCNVNGSKLSAFEARGRKRRRSNRKE